MASNNPTIVVVGAGAVGLSTAVQIQENIPGVVVTLIAEKFEQQTTSDGAAGIFMPSMIPPEDTSKELLFRWASDSFEFFKKLVTSKEASEAGISHMTGYGFSSNNTFVQLVGHFDLAVICTGLGSRELLGDELVVPVRGQVIRVKAPWIKTFLFNDCYNSYIIPGKETCVVGGTSQYGNDNIDVSDEDTERIWSDACRIMPSLANAEWAWQWVGLRPYRKSIRLERETKHFSNGKLEVVYNYGHGGNGLALSWGTAKHASQLVAAALGDNSLKSNL